MTYLADSSGGVASSVQGVGFVTHAGGKLGHLGNTSGIVGDGAVHVDGKASLRSTQTLLSNWRARGLDKYVTDTRIRCL